MPVHPRHTLTIYLLPALLAHAAATAAEPTYSDILPILQSRCVFCHSGQLPPLDLHLDSLEHLLAGSQNGAIVQAGDPAGSELIKRLKGISQPRMPMSGPPYLSDAQIDLFERWIANGLKPGDAIPAQEPAGFSPAPSPQPGAAVNYSHVAAIFARRCVTCHSQPGILGAPPEGYVLSSYATTLATDERARVVPGSAEASELVRRIRGHARPRMPYDGPPFLDDAEIALIVDWIEQGARDAQGIPARIARASKVRLHGTLEAGGAGWQLDGLPLEINAATRVDDSPQPGDYVQVRGRLRPDGSLAVERIRAR